MACALVSSALAAIWLLTADSSSAAVASAPALSAIVRTEVRMLSVALAREPAICPTSSLLDTVTA